MINFLILCMCLVILSAVILVNTTDNFQNEIFRIKLTMYKLYTLLYFTTPNQIIDMTVSETNHILRIIAH